MIYDGVYLGIYLYITNPYISWQSTHQLEPKVAPCGASAFKRCSF